MARSHTRLRKRKRKKLSPEDFQKAVTLFAEAAGEFTGALLRISYLDAIQLTPKETTT